MSRMERFDNLMHIGELSRDARKGIDLALQNIYDSYVDRQWVDFGILSGHFVLLKAAPDNPEWFPKGKWATLQAIEELLDKKAKEFWSEQTSGD